MVSSSESSYKTSPYYIYNIIYFQFITYCKNILYIFLSILLPKNEILCLIYRKSVCITTDAKFHIMDSGTECTERFSMAIICPQSGSRLSHLPLLRFRRHLSKKLFLGLVYIDFSIKSSIIFATFIH